MSGFTPTEMPNTVQIVHQNITQTFFPPVGGVDPQMAMTPVESTKIRGQSMGPDLRPKTGVDSSLYFRPGLGHPRQNSTASGKSAFFHQSDSIGSLTPQHNLSNGRKQRLLKSANLRTAGMLNLADSSIKAQIHQTVLPSQQSWIGSRSNLNSEPSAQNLLSLNQRIGSSGSSTKGAQNSHRVRDQNYLQKEGGEDIKPEMAAEVVKQYLLPMFQADSKNYIRDKRAQQRKNLGLTRKESIPVDQIVQNLKPIEEAVTDFQKAAQIGSVYKELKLSANLLQQLSETREALEFTLVELEETRDKCARLQEKLEVQWKLSTVSNEKILSMEQSLSLSQNVNNAHQQKSENISKKVDELKRQLFQTQLQAKQLAKELVVEREDKKRLKLELMQVSHDSGLQQAENDIMKEKLSSLHEAVTKLPNPQEISARHSVELMTLQKSLKLEIETNKQQREEVSQLNIEKDKLLNYIKDLNNSRQSILNEKERLGTSLREKIYKLEKQLQNVSDERDRFYASVQHLEKDLKTQAIVREKLKNKLKKVQKGGTVDKDQKICKNCGQEYKESQNYNWSCRRHASDWGGTMWWCCGQPNKNVLGCKFSKHYSNDVLDDEAFEDPQEREERELMRQAKKKCLTCKKIGHDRLKCPYDPNFNQSVNKEEELTRLEKITQNPVEKRTKMDMQQVAKLVIEIFLSRMNKESLKDSDNQKNFMDFDDYNYQLLNKRLFKNENQEEEDDSDSSDQEEEKVGEHISVVQSLDVPSDHQLRKSRNFESVREEGSEEEKEKASPHSRDSQDSFGQASLAIFRERQRNKHPSHDKLVNVQNVDLFANLINMKEQLVDSDSHTNNKYNILKAFQQGPPSRVESILLKDGVFESNSKPGSKHGPLQRMNSPKWKLKQKLRKSNSPSQNEPSIRPMPMNISIEQFRSDADELSHRSFASQGSFKPPMKKHRKGLNDSEVGLKDDYAREEFIATKSKFEQMRHEK